jgi:Transposase DDE domain
MIYKALSESVKYIILDGTQWKRGKKCVHLLTLCIVYHGIAIPIYWHQLNKKGGHSSEEDQQKLFTQACERYQLSGKILLADREFMGEKSLSFLVHNKIDFIIRMSKTCYKKPISESLGFVYSKLEKIVSKSTKTKKSVIKQFQMNSITYSIVMVKNDKDDPLEPLMYFISTLQDKTQILDGYRIRWQIEICFKHLKTNAAPLGD